MFNEEKKVYSLNLSAYIMFATGEQPEYKTEDGAIYYCVFPTTDAVKQAVIEFKNPDLEIKLHDYLELYKVIKNNIYELRGDKKHE